MIVSDYSQMDRILREERQYILDICKKIKKAGCNVLLIQKSILRSVTYHPSSVLGKEGVEENVCGKGSSLCLFFFFFFGSCKVFVKIFFPSMHVVEANLAFSTLVQLELSCKIWL